MPIIMHAFPHLCNLTANSSSLYQYTSTIMHYVPWVPMTLQIQCRPIMWPYLAKPLQSRKLTNLIFIDSWSTFWALKCYRVISVIFIPSFVHKKSTFLMKISLFSINFLQVYWAILWKVLCQLVSVYGRRSLVVLQDGSLDSGSHPGSDT